MKILLLNFQLCRLLAVPNSLSKKFLAKKMKTNRKFRRYTGVYLQNVSPKSQCEFIQIVAPLWRRISVPRSLRSVPAKENITSETVRTDNYAILAVS